MMLIITHRTCSTCPLTLGRLWPRAAEVYLRDKLAHFHLNDGILQLHLQKLRIGGTALAGLNAVGGEDPQHPHVAAHNQLVCKRQKMIIARKKEGEIYMHSD